MRKSFFRKFLCLFPALFMMTATSSYSEASHWIKPVSPTPECLLKATRQAHIPFTVFLAIMKTEGGHVGTVRRNRNGSHDLGVMQINDQVWVRKIAEADFQGNIQEARDRLIYDGCYNMEVSAMIYRLYIDEAGGLKNPEALALAVGHYNSHTPEKMRLYMNRVGVNFRAVLKALDRE